MKISRVTYRFLKNLGDYQHEVCELTADVAYHENHEAVYRRLRDEVHRLTSTYCKDKQDNELLDALRLILDNFPEALNKSAFRDKIAKYIMPLHDHILDDIPF